MHRRDTSVAARILNLLGGNGVRVQAFSTDWDSSPRLDDLPEGTRYVLCLRHPADVARSLERRGGISRNRGIYFWLEYVQRALAHTAGKPRCFVYYDRFRDDLSRELSGWRGSSATRNGRGNQTWRRPSGASSMRSYCNSCQRRSLERHLIPSMGGRARRSGWPGECTTCSPVTSPLTSRRSSER